MKRSGRINPKSAKRVSDDKLYQFLRGVRFGLEGVPCRLRLEMCSGYMSEVHHRQSKGIAAERVYDVDNWLPSCRPCHDYVTANIGHAYELELSQKSGALDPLPMLRSSTCRLCFADVRWVHDERGRSIVIDAGDPDPAGTVEIFLERAPFHSDEEQHVCLEGLDPDPDRERFVDHRGTCLGWPIRR